MKSRKITEGDIAELRVSALPTRPTAPAEFGGKGYTAKELKEAFDALPVFIVEMYNALIEDITSGEFLKEVNIDQKSLFDYLNDIRSDLDSLMQ